MVKPEMDKSMRYFWIVVVLLLGACDSTLSPSKQKFTFSVTNLQEPQHFDIPLQCDNWCTRGARVVKNTANDSVKIWDQYFAPGQTGKVFSMEAYGIKGDFFNYTPYKASAGEVTITWYVE
jgi:hypothetical protein